MPILEVQDLSVQFRTERGCLRATDNVSFELQEGKTTCLVGESGCGKSVTALALLRLVPPPGEITQGKVLFQSQDLLSLSEAELRQLRGNDISLIFQEPLSALNPVYPVGSQISEMVRSHHRIARREAREKTLQLMDLVGLHGASHSECYPHELSGGMRQRVMIAMALACHPRVLVADEPTTALDVTIQAQILDLLARLQSDLGMSILFITHDLSLVAEVADQVLVMYAGQIVEQAEVELLFEDPRHPYTQALLRSVPRPPRTPGSRLKTIPGQVPDLTAPAAGCRFADRCESAFARCRLQPPELRAVGPQQAARCFLVAS